MKKFPIATGLVVAASTAATAQSSDGGMFRAEADQGTMHASDFIGMRVYATETEIETDASEGEQSDWMDIGEINHVMMSRDGQVQGVLVDIGGFLGIGERQVAVRMDEFRFVSDSATE